MCATFIATINHFEAAFSTFLCHRTRRARSSNICRAKFSISVFFVSFYSHVISFFVARTQEAAAFMLMLMLKHGPTMFKLVIKAKQNLPSKQR